MRPIRAEKFKRLQIQKRLLLKLNLFETDIIKDKLLYLVKWAASITKSVMVVAKCQKKCYAIAFLKGN